LSLQLNKQNRIIIVNLLLLITFLPTRGGEEVAGVIRRQLYFVSSLATEKPVSRQIPQQKQRQITRDLSTAGVIICRFAKDYDIYQIKI